MLKLFFRQILKHKYQLFVIIIFWVAAGYYIFKYNHIFFAQLTNYFSFTPERGIENPQKAYQYFKKAQDTLEEGNASWYCTVYETESCKLQKYKGKVRLDLMKASCQYIPVINKYDMDYFRPHWYEKITRWNLNSNRLLQEKKITDLTEPVIYWEENSGKARKALKHLLDAINYAYVIEPSVIGDKNAKSIVIPKELENVSEALCMTMPGKLAWGDYIEHLENVKFYYLFPEEDKKNYSHVIPAVKEEIVIKALKGDDRYLNALLHYSAGSLPSSGNPVDCAYGPFRLACSSPIEALKLYQKLLYIQPEKAAFYRLRLGQINSLRIHTGEETDILRKAIEDLNFAAKNSATENDARINLARLYNRLKKHKEAYNELRILYYRLPMNSELNSLFRNTLIGMGQHMAADCFSEQSETVYGKRTHCQNFKP